MKGQKTGGRSPGTPNKLTRELRTVMKDILSHELETLPERLDKLDTIRRIDVFLKLVPYVFPKLENVPSEHGEPLSWGIND